MELQNVLTPEQIAEHRHALELAAALPMSPVGRAIAVASVAHRRQVRKGTTLPYVVHLLEVHEIVSEVQGVTEAQKVASILHDYDEDTEFTHARPGDIARWFGEEVANHVRWLTKVSRPEDGNRAQRAVIDRAHSASAPGETQTIKYGDIYSNARNIAQTLPKFAQIWLPEKVLQMDVMRNGDAILYKRTMNVLDTQLLALGMPNAQGLLNEHAASGTVRIKP